MIRPHDIWFLAAVLALAAVGPTEVLARINDGRPASIDRRGGDHSLKVAQADATDLVVRLDRLEEQIRQLTGAVEQLQYRNQQLEQQMRRIQPGAAEPRSADSVSPAARYTPPTGSMGSAPQGDKSSVVGEGAPPPFPQSGSRHSGVFDPNQNPNAPGAPRTLGQIAASTSPGYPGGSPPGAVAVAPAGPAPGTPLYLGNASAPPAEEPTVIPAPQYGERGPLPSPPRYPSAPGAQQLVMAPTSSPKDEYDLAYGYVLRKDYALAEESFRAFLKQFPNDRLTSDATYWLGESLFQLQRYHDAAEAFLTVSTKAENSPKGPESLMRLGQSLAALGEKDAACSTFGQVSRKYPRAAHLRQTVEREQKRVGC